MSLAVITGASTGIGHDLARLCAAAGHDLLVVARNQSQLDGLAATVQAESGKSVRTLSLDLSQPGAASAIVESLAGEPVDILINNAGIGLRGFFHELDADKQLGMLRLNVEALTHLTALLLPGMIARGRGRVMNVASLAAFQPGPLMAVYYATKAYVLSLSEALHNETRPFGVTVTALCPGPTATEFGNRAEMGGTKLFEMNLMRSAEVAQIGFDAMMEGRPVVIAGTQNKLMAFATRFVPRQLAAGLARSLQEKGGR